MKGVIDMHWLFWAIPVSLIIIILLTAVLRALAFKPRPEAPAEVTPIDFDRQKAIDDLQSMIRCVTVSNADPALDDEAEFQKFVHLLPQLFPAVYQTCSCEQIGTHGLLCCWKGDRKSVV